MLVALIPVHKLLAVYDTPTAPSFSHAAAHAGQVGADAVRGRVRRSGRLLAWADQLVRRQPAVAATLGRRSRAACSGRGGRGGRAPARWSPPTADPFRFIARQWNGFSHPQQSAAGVALHRRRQRALRLLAGRRSTRPPPTRSAASGQDNFADYYVNRRRTCEEPSGRTAWSCACWPTPAFVGFGLFAAFIVGALIGRDRRPAAWSAARAAAAAASRCCPVHRLADPRLGRLVLGDARAGGAGAGFLAMALALEPATPRCRGGPGTRRRGLRRERRRSAVPRARADRTARAATAADSRAGAIAGARCPGGRRGSCSGSPTSRPARCRSRTDVRARTPPRRWRPRSRRRLNPLSAIPGRTRRGDRARDRDSYIARRATVPPVASTSEPGGWFAWLGAGSPRRLSGKRQQARHDFATRHSINSRQPGRPRLRSRGYETTPPLTSAEAVYTVS